MRVLPFLCFPCGRDREVEAKNSIIPDFFMRQKRQFWQERFRESSRSEWKQIGPKPNMKTSRSRSKPVNATQLWQCALSPIMLSWIRQLSLKAGSVIAAGSGVLDNRRVLQLLPRSQWSACRVTAIVSAMHSCTQREEGKAPLRFEVLGLSGSFNVLTMSTIT